MQGADDFADLFKTSQHGRLYIVSSAHARGKTFRVFVLPEGEEARGNGPANAPLNKDAVEVYGIVGGNPGWGEYYGWLHKGPWQEDLNVLVEKTRRQISKSKALRAKQSAEKATAAQERELELLATYSRPSPP